MQRVIKDTKTKRQKRGKYTLHKKDEKKDAKIKNGGKCLFTKVYVMSEARIMRPAYIMPV